MTTASARSAVLAAAVLLGLAGTPARSDAAFINTADRGWYDDTGLHFTSNTNYLTGYLPPDPDFPEDIPAESFHSFFTFNLAGQVQAYLSASFVVYNPGGVNDFGLGYSSPDATETITLFGVTTAISTLTAGTGGTAAYADLGAGPVYGSAVVSAASNGRFVTINLNATGLAALNAARGGSFAFGGAITTLSGQTAEEYVFGFSGVSGNPQDGLTYLNVTTVPAPAGLVLGLLGVGSCGVGGLARRRLTAKVVVA